MLADGVTVELSLIGDQAALRLDSVDAGRWTIPKRGDDTPVVVAVTAPRGVRARVLVSVAERAAGARYVLSVARTAVD